MATNNYGLISAARDAAMNGSRGSSSTALVPVNGGKAMNGNGMMEAGCMSCAPSATAVPAYMPWSPALGACPQDLPRLTLWFFKGYCTFNTFAAMGSVKLFTNTITVPDPLGAAGYDIGPEGNAQSLGVYFPRDWVSEAVYRGIYRIKVSFMVVPIEAGGLTQAEIQRALFDSLELSILQAGSQDNFHTALNVGEAQDAEKSTDTPSAGGFWLCRGHEFVPFAPAPEMQAYDFRGQAPASGTYTITAALQTYFRIIV